MKPASALDVFEWWDDALSFARSRSIETQLRHRVYRFSGRWAVGLTRPARKLRVVR